MFLIFISATSWENPRRPLSQTMLGTDLSTFATLAVSTSKLQTRLINPEAYSKQSCARKRTPHIKVITSEKRHRVEWKRCKNHDDVWSVIRGVSVEWRSLVFPTFDERRGQSSLRGSSPLISALHPALYFMRSREPPQKTRTAINYALTHSDSPIIYTIAIYCFYDFIHVRLLASFITAYILTYTTCISKL